MGASAPTRTSSGFAFGATTSSRRATTEAGPRSWQKASRRTLGTKGPPPGNPWLSPSEEAPRYSRPTKTVLRRWTDAKGLLYSAYLITTLTHLYGPQIAKLYDQRGGMEVDIKGDKRGFGIEQRRKKSFFRPGGLGAPGAALPQPLGVLQRVVPERDGRRQAWGAAACQGRLGDASSGEVVRWGCTLSLKLPHLHPWAEALAHGAARRLAPFEMDGAPFWRKI